ncbi:unnamed protein product, partial [Mesorhabditis spiculigera]
MDSEEFREWGKKMVDFVADMWDGIPQRTPLPDSSASDATLIAFYAARAKAVEGIKTNLSSSERKEDFEEAPESDVYLHPFHDPAVFNQLVAYCSDQAHSSVEKAAMLAGVRLRKLRSGIDVAYGNYSVTAATLEAAIKEDRDRGLTPFIFIATIGTTNTCAVDPIAKLAPICNREKIWVHVDAAYAGSFLLCPEFRSMAAGMELVDSFNYNAHKQMMINFDCSPLWLKDGKSAVKYFNVDPVYLKHEHQATTADYRHLQVALGRRFRSLKIWFVMRTLGIENIQKMLRDSCHFADVFAQLIKDSMLFELFVPNYLGLVCFRLKKETNEVNEEFCEAINSDRRIHLVPSKQKSEDHVRYAYEVITEIAQKLLDQKGH